MKAEGAVLLGVQGWSWPAWTQDFYPYDMPPEWRLAFYNTQFDCVFLRAEQWRGVADAELAQWAEDTHGRFMFLLEAAPGDPVPPELAGRAIGLRADDPAVIWFDAATDIKALAARIRVASDTPRYLVSRDGDLAQLERVRTLLGLLGLGRT